MIDIEKEDLVLDYLVEAVAPFTVRDLIKATGMKQTPENQEDINFILTSLPDFVEEDGVFYPKESFLSSVPFRIKPSEFEIQEGILIPGHRFIPFQPFALAQKDLLYVFNGQPLKTREIKLKAKHMIIYFSLLDFERMPIKNIEDILDDDSDLFVDAIEMREFYKQTNFVFGDSIIATTNLDDPGVFALSYDSWENTELRQFEIEKFNRFFKKTLEDVLQMDIDYPNLEKQLLYTYYYLDRKQYSIPGNAIAPLIIQSQEFTLSSLPDGRKILHFSDESPEDLGVYPNFSDLPVEMNDHDQPDLDSVEGVLQYLGNNNSLTVVRALILDQLASERRYSYKFIENYLFKGLEKPFMPDDLCEEFKKMIRLEYKEIKKKYNPESAFLPLTTVRKKILDVELQISEFLRYLDAAMILPEELPQDDMMRLMELDKTLHEVLVNLEVSQLSGEINITEIKKTLKLLDRLIPELPGRLNRIKSQLNL